MKKTKDLGYKLNIISNITINSRKLMRDSYKMLETDTSEKFSLISRDKFLTRVKDSFWKLSIIELAKIFGSKNDNFRIEYFIDQIILNHSGAEWEFDITESELRIFESILSCDEVKVRRKKLKELRDQHYAHKDQNPNNNIYEIKFYFEDFEYLIKVVESIIEEISLKVLKQNSIINYLGEDVDNFLDKYLENQKQYLK